MDPQGTRERGRSNERPARPRTRRAGRDTRVPIDVGPGAPLPSPIGCGAGAQAGPFPPDILPRLLQTQVAYRQLVSSGLTSTEAAGLIGYVSGLPPNVTPWTMAQINRLLFLRSLYREGEWGRRERRPGRRERRPGRRERRPGRRD
jgi:hypothetical protein